MSLRAELGDSLGTLPQWQQTGLLAISVFALGYFLIKFGEKLIDGAMYRSNKIDATLRNFLDSVTNVLGWVILVMVELSIFGVNLAGLLGGLAIGGFVIGFALKDTLGNLAAGVMLLFYRPFKVGDTVTISGESGDVIDLGISLTTLLAADGRIITIPNGSILAGTVTNHTRHSHRRADVMVGIDYKADISVAIKAILEAINDDSRVMSDPAPSVRITELGESAIGLQVRPWVGTSDYWQAKADFNGIVKKALDGVGIGIPFPQREIRMVEG